MNQQQQQAVLTAFQHYVDLSAQADAAYAAVAQQNATVDAAHINATVTVPNANKTAQDSATAAWVQDTSVLNDLTAKAQALTAARGDAYVAYQQANSDSLQNAGAQEIPGNTGPIRTA